MCGIAGIIDQQSAADQSYAALTRMLNTVVHRGPDDAGVWQSAGLVLGHRRLSILDLSPNGHQPMVSRSGRYVICLNGEIYNHADLRGELVAAGASFRGHSDTEVLLELIERHGLERALEACIGMFAIALWDNSSRVLHLARDRLGEKPLYYGWHRGCFLFGSELRALVAHEAFVRDVDRNSLALLCRFGYIPAPYSIYRQTYKLPPGCMLVVPFDAREIDRCIMRKYWSLNCVARAGIERPFACDYQEAADELERLLTDAVKRQMQADVPLGAFLSGGIDSSTVVALMQSLATQPVRTFSIGFNVPELNEAPHAKMVAGYLGTKHSEQYVDRAEALAVVPLLPTIYDEPLGDPSQIPTFLLARMARKEVTVSLSGDGGDELFCGYAKYRFGSWIHRIPLRRLIGKGIELLPSNLIERLVLFAPPVSGRKLTKSRVRTLMALLKARDSRHLAELTSMIYRGQETLVSGSTLPPTPFDRVEDIDRAASYESLAMLLDRETYLPDDILHKVDRATMAVSLESRAPFLDHRVVEFAARLPLKFLVGSDGPKSILRNVLYRYVPKQLVDRPKAGFSVPLASWIRGPLLAWVQDLLSTAELKKHNYFNPRVCHHILKTHLDGVADNSRILWAILSFQSWRQYWL